MHWRYISLSSVLSLACLGMIDAVFAQSANPITIGQSQRSQPPSLCDPTGCAYGERYVSVDSSTQLRIQGIGQCGQRCGRSYWITNTTTNELLLSVDDLPGENHLLFGWMEQPRDFKVHTMVFTPDRSPSAEPFAGWYVYRIFTWDAVNKKFTAPPPTSIPRDDLPRLLQGLTTQGYAPFFSSWVD
jgi:hypothetical protein